ncbi:MAG: ABC transporter permease [Longimonas sp.]|uniref:FtsX-like permease family protein n=1 Tax=Longimonas sp. TaxID=2039626 RepID=UPI00334C2A9C
MLFNYLKVAWRTLWRQKTASIINITGLAVGMACCLWLLLVVQHEWAYDRFHDDVDQIVRINQETVRGDGSIEQSALVPPPLGPVVETTVPEVASVVRLMRRSMEFTHETRTEEQHVLFADPAFFDVFTAPTIAGDPRAALQAPDRLVLTESEAERLFGDSEALGQTLTMGFEQGTREMTVDAVVEDPPATTSVPFVMLVSMEQVQLTMPEGFADQLMESWQMGITHSFARLEAGHDAESLTEPLRRIVEDHVEDTESRTLWAQPLTEVRHSPDISGSLASTNDPQIMYILGAIAILILLIAAINFVTLTLGQSARRSREVGVRKALGATHMQLGQQFWWEAVLICLLALVVGLGAAYLFRPMVAHLIDIPIEFSIDEYPLFWVGVLALVLGVGLLAGGYPAWRLARMDAADVLRGTHQVRTRSAFSRGLIVGQFAVSVGFVACAFIMSQQLQHMMNADLGYTDAPLVTMPVETDLGAPRFDAFRTEAERHPAIGSVAGSWVTFGTPGNRVELERRDDNVISGYYNQVTPNYATVLELDVVEGQSFHEDGASRGLLVNERLVRELGLESPVGETLTVHDANPMTAPLGEMPILGVVADFHVTGLDEEIPPLILIPHEEIPFGLRNYTAQLYPDETQGGLAALSAVWTDIFPDQPLDYTFLQDRVAEQYETEARWSTLIGYAALLVLLIACFGVFGIAALEVAKRRPEIGIRKVLGASAPSLVAHLSKDIVLLVALGALLAIPLAYIAMSRWLEHFAYRIDLAWWMFVGAGVVALLVALATASYHTLRAAWMDPTQAIRQE